MSIILNNNFSFLLTLFPSHFKEIILHPDNFNSSNISLTRLLSTLLSYTNKTFLSDLKFSKDLDITFILFFLQNVI